MKLYKDQIECLEKIKSNFSASPILVQAPTGYGKTVVLSKLLAEYPNKSALICFNKVSLIDQTVEKVLLLNSFLSTAEIGVYNGSLGKKEIEKRVVIGTVQSLIKAPKRHFDIIIIDEAHRSNMEKSSSTFKKMIERFSHETIVGFTATPFTNMGSIYGEEKFWNEPIYSANIKDLINDGRLCKLVFQNIDNKYAIDTSKVRVSAGDYNQKDLNAVSAIKELVTLQVNDSLERIRGNYLYPIYMCVSIEHAEMVQECLGNASIVHSKQSNKERQKNLENFKNRKTEYLVSILVISEGFDFPPADCLVLIRPTKSYVLFAQAVGRVLRNHLGKEKALLLDYGNVVNNLGNPLNINSSLIKNKKTIKVCELCYQQNDSANITCEKCNQPFYKMCKFCFELSPLGKKCNCKESQYYAGLEESYIEKLLKNTEIQPYLPGSVEGFFVIDKVKILLHESKKGNMGMKFIFKDPKNQELTIFGNGFKGWKGNCFSIIKGLLGITGAEYDHSPSDFFIQYTYDEEYGLCWDEDGIPYGYEINANDLKSKAFQYQKETEWYKITKWI